MMGWTWSLAEFMLRGAGLRLLLLNWAGTCPVSPVDPSVPCLYLSVVRRSSSYFNMIFTSDFLGFVL